MNCNETITDFDNLYRAFLKSKTRRSYTKSALYFQLDAVSKLRIKKKELEQRKYKVSGYTEFQVLVPKLRNVKACKFEDKIVQHVLCDNILSVSLPNLCIRDSYSGQKGKGTDDARNRLRWRLQAFSFSNGGFGYILKGDISKYYDSISHDIAKDIMQYYFPSDTHWLINEFIDSTDGDIGVALGNQINTIVSNLYLDGMDRFITGELGIRYYGRYADDFYLIHESKKYLKYCLQCIREFASTLGLCLNPKTQIIPYKNGLSFLGFHFYPRVDGIEVKIDNGKKRNYLRKFNRMCRMVREKRLELSKLEKSYISWKEHVNKNVTNSAEVLSYFERRLEELRRDYK